MYWMEHKQLSEVLGKAVEQYIEKCGCYPSRLVVVEISLLSSDIDVVRKDYRYLELVTVKSGLQVGHFLLCGGLKRQPRIYKGERYPV